MTGPGMNRAGRRKRDAGRLYLADLRVISALEDENDWSATSRRSAIIARASLAAEGRRRRWPRPGSGS